MNRPLDEVASLAHLLNQTGERPRPGDEALHMAAVSRPLDEVRQLISLLKKPPHTDEEADTALRAAATERPIAEVAALIADFRPEGNVPPAEPRPAQETSLLPFGPAALAPPAPDTAPDTALDQAMPALALSAPSGAMAPPPFAPPAPVPATPAEGPAVPAEAEPVTGAEVAGAAGAPAAEATAAAVTGTTEGAPAPAGDPAAVAPRMPALRSVLRWPAAAALLLIGVIHLPTDIVAVRSGSTASAASMVIAAACLTLACLLPLHDAVWTWALGAAAAVATAGLHSVGVGLKSVHVLRDSLGSSFAGATTVVVLCAVVAAALAGVALLRKPAQRAADKV
ncbi:hypothetical protein [Streptomyces sp. NPDC048111]|uniref:hypothetical protein n=1 Tax=Streptomyces sp. NPDC048111 TaxID=3365500 RepID=UPI003714A0B0